MSLEFVCKYLIYLLKMRQISRFTLQRRPISQLINWRFTPITVCRSWPTQAMEMVWGAVVSTSALHLHVKELNILLLIAVMTWWNINAHNIWMILKIFRMHNYIHLTLIVPTLKYIISSWNCFIQTSDFSKPNVLYKWRICIRSYLLEYLPLLSNSFVGDQQLFYNVMYKSDND